VILTSSLVILQLTQKRQDVLRVFPATQLDAVTYFPPYLLIMMMEVFSVVKTGLGFFSPILSERAYDSIAH
jgi:hypothetical protein